MGFNVPFVCNGKHCHYELQAHAWSNKSRNYENFAMTPGSSSSDANRSEYKASVDGKVLYVPLTA